jgi:hypothetical protein
MNGLNFGVKKNRKAKELEKILTNKISGKLTKADIMNDLGDEELLEQGFAAEQRKTIVKSCGVFFPDTTKKSAWDIMGFFFIIFQSVVIPYRMCFEVEPEGFFSFLEIVIDSFFMSDILMSFNTGFY